MNKYYKYILDNNFNIDIASQKNHIYRIYLVEDNKRTGEWIEFKGYGGSKKLLDAATKVREHTHLSYALHAICEIIKEKQHS